MAIGWRALLGSPKGVPLTAVEYLKLAKDFFSLAAGTRDPETRKAFQDAGLEYLAKAKALDPTAPQTLDS